MKKALLTRYGGIGDVAPVMVAAEQLEKNGYDVTVALRDDGGAIRQTELLKNTKWYNKSMDFRQIGPWGNRCVKYKHGWKVIESFYSEFDLVVDFMFVTEGNNTCRSTIVKRPTDIWQRTRNSNWINWYDQHLSWVGINPFSVPKEDKRPTFLLSKDEKKEVKNLKEKYPKVFGIHPAASSTARTWNQAKDMVPMLNEEYDGCLTALWNGEANDWGFSINGEAVPVTIKAESPLRRSMVVLAACDCFVGVDTGFTHVAEGLGVFHIAIYSTVPAWTRAEYYQHQVPIDPGEEHPEYYNFCIQDGDPLRIQDGEDSLSEREKLVNELYESRAPMEVVVKKLNCDKHGAELELEALLKKKESWNRQQSKALSDVSADMVFNKIKELMT